MLNLCGDLLRIYKSGIMRLALFYIIMTSVVSACRATEETLQRHLLISSGIQHSLSWSCIFGCNCDPGGMSLLASSQISPAFFPVVPHRFPASTLEVAGNNGVFDINESISCCRVLLLEQDVQQQLKL